MSLPVPISVLGITSSPVGSGEIAVEAQSPVTAGPPLRLQPAIEHHFLNSFPVFTSTSFRMIYRKIWKVVISTTEALFSIMPKYFLSQSGIGFVLLLTISFWVVFAPICSFLYSPGLISFLAGPTSMIHNVIASLAETFAIVLFSWMACSFSHTSHRTTQMSL